MGIKLMSEGTIPQCNFCDNIAKYDAPTKMGQWAYMCEVCAKRDGRNLDIGTEFKLREPSNKKPMKETLVGIEQQGLDYWEDVVMDVHHREIECPTCGEIKCVEPDALYIYTCEGCNQNIQVPAGIY